MVQQVMSVPGNSIPMAPRLVMACCLALAGSIASAGIAFEDVTAHSGIQYRGLSYGAGWGDFNGDGWPDLWTGNHFNPPSLYVNLRNGTFADVAGKTVTADKMADKHGVAWADFDNDGDQDLLQSVGAVMGTGAGPKQLLVNDGGKALTDEAARLGADYPLGRGRTPVWLDADGDGRLDLLLMNAHRPDGKAGSAILKQDARGFQDANEFFGFSLEGGRRLGKIRGLLSNLVQLRFRMPHYVNANDPFAQLADLTGDGKMELLAYSRPSHIYSLGKAPFADLTAALDIRVPRSITDAAVEDFNGDGQPDLFFTHAAEWAQWQLVAPTELWVAFSGEVRQGVDEISFHAGGRLSFELQPFGVDLEKVFIGPQRKHPDKLEFSLSPEEMTGESAPAARGGETPFLEITYDVGKQLWIVRCIKLDVGVVVKAAAAIEQIQTTGFQEPQGMTPYTLLERKEQGYAQVGMSEAPANKSCSSVAAGDFDNDMDIDLYAVCPEPARQETGLLLENDGKGGFRPVPASGGAPGAKAGRGDVVVTADYDRDGFLDLMITNGSDLASPLIAPGPNVLYRNLGNRNHWIEFDLEGRKSNRDGIGSIVEVEAGGVVQKRGQGGGMHRSAQNHQRLHFGLGANTRVDRVTVRWPRGFVQELQGLESDCVVRIVEQAAR